MSRGPGRIERAIRALFDAHPDLAFVTDELVEHCYPDAERVNDQPQRVATIAARWARTRTLSVPRDPRLAEHETRAAERMAGSGVLEFPRKYQVSVLRAAKKVVARDPDWTWRASESQGGGVVFYNKASVQSWRLADVIGDWRTIYRSPKRRRQHDDVERRDGLSMCTVLEDRDAALRRAASGDGSSHAQMVARHVAYRDGDAETRARMDAEKAAWIAAFKEVGQALGRR